MYPRCVAEDYHYQTLSVAEDVQISDSDLFVYRKGAIVSMLHSKMKSNYKYKEN